MTFSLPITPSQLDSGRSRLRAQGIPVPESDSGQIEIKGVTIQYDYSHTTGTFSVKVLKKPMLIKDSYVEWVVRDWFR